MRTKLFERRTEMVQLRAKGLPLSYVVNNLMDKYEVSRQALYADWKRRKHWIEILLSIQDPETVFMDLLSRHEEIRKQAILERVKADNSNARIGALNLERRINMDFFEMLVLHELAVDVEKIKEKLELRI